MSYRSSREPLPVGVVDRLFSALTIRYGAAFLDRWRDLDLQVVKDDWARELAVFGDNLAALRFGLEHLGEKPPTVIDFKRICASAPLREPMLESMAPTRGPTPAERAELLELAAMFRSPGRANRDWAYTLIHRHENGDPRPPTAVAMARRAIAGDPRGRGGDAE